MMTDTQKQLLRKIAEAIIESVREAGPMGAPAGPMYAALMSYGFSLDNFEQIMSGLVAAKMLRKSGHLYFAVNPPQGANVSASKAVRESYDAAQVSASKAVRESYDAAQVSVSDVIKGGIVMKNQKGFTLYEVVIGIGLLASVGIAATIVYVAFHFIHKVW